ncbi:MAG: L-histidine N(alpha)-methyltransferase [Pseudomonadota bacterium]
MSNASAPMTAQTSQTQKHIDDIVEGLSLPQKVLSPKYFYDERGSELFEAITLQPEYYPTRTELGILKQNINAIGDALGHDVSLIEFGAGASVKVRVLLDNLADIAVFVPVDISGDHLQLAADELAADYPDIEVLPVAADFTRPFPLPSPVNMPARNIVFFPGSTIGNFPPDAALGLLQTMRAVAKDNGGLLIGVDLKKDHSVLERAYNDEAGVTAQFNRNMLVHLNREYGSDFDPEAFDHRAVYNAAASRIEMHLISTCPQRVTIGGHVFAFAEGEYILTECSYKYALEGFAALAKQAGFDVQQVWTDSEQHFSLQYAVAI